MTTSAPSLLGRRASSCGEVRNCALPGSGPVTMSGLGGIGQGIIVVGMPDCALELSFDPAAAAAVEARWQALRDAGLPSQLDHKGMTNAPHLTLVVAARIPDAVVSRARIVFDPVLPLTLAVRGLVVFGTGSRVTLALLAEPPRDVADAVVELRAMTPPVRHPVWTPHVTLGRRIPRDRLGDALAALHECDTASPLSAISANRLRWWDPETSSIDVVAGV